MKHTMIEHSAGITALECDFQQARNEYLRIRELTRIPIERMGQLRASLFQTWLQEHYPNIACDAYHKFTEDLDGLKSHVKIIFDESVPTSDRQRVCDEFNEYTKALIAR